jgi:peptidoglycan/LPS O-acetylase OafA/YrhL
MIALALSRDGLIYMTLAGPLAASLITAARSSVCLGPDGFLAAPALRYTGRISYGLCLYHVPIFLTGKTVLHVRGVGLVGLVGLIGLSYAVAAISCEFVEKPFLRLKGQVPRNDPGGCRAGGDFGGKVEAV